MELLKEFEELCKYIRESTGGDLVCGYCEYDDRTISGEHAECPGFETDECFKLKESIRRRCENYVEIIRCKDCKYYKPQFNEDGYYITNCQYSKAAEVNGFCHMARRKEE